MAELICSKSKDDEGKNSVTYSDASQYPHMEIQSKVAARTIESIQCKHFISSGEGALTSCILLITRACERLVCEDYVAQYIRPPFQW